jgi:hypothetical protein
MNRPFQIIIIPIIPPAKAVCPVATPPYTFNPNTNFCERPICPSGTQLDASGKVCVEQFTLTLNAPPGNLEPTGTAAGDANSSKALSVLVKSAKTGLPKSGAVVRITLDVADGTGGHDHPKGVDRPRGTLTGCAATPNLPNNYDCITGTDGKAAFTFTATQVSGTHTLSASCISPVCTNSQAVAQDVRVAGLATIPASPFYAFVGSTPLHSDNHYLTPQAEAILNGIAVAYAFESRFKVGGVSPLPLTLNDASLIWGGLFDAVNANWKAPHVEHRRGTAIDIRANQAEGAIDAVNFKNFEKMIASYNHDFGYNGYNIDPLLECTKDKRTTPIGQRHNRKPITDCISQLDGSQDPNRHYHIRLMGVKE